jgi:hypothetical protein
MQQQQRAAQRQLGEQAVRLPLDLLEFDAVHRPALLRAFGGLVIAADDATAATLIKQFGLPSVTLQVGWVGWGNGLLCATSWSLLCAESTCDTQLVRSGANEFLMWCVLGKLLQVKPYLLMLWSATMLSADDCKLQAGATLAC